jgi:hypothetical protein
MEITDLKLLTLAAENFDIAENARKTLWGAAITMRRGSNGRIRW